MFEASQIFRDFDVKFPNAERVEYLLKQGSCRDLEAFIRLWLTEGVPYAFHKSPILYEEMRTWIAAYLNICPKEVGLIGSARSGFAMGERKKFGRPFGPKSDLDLCIVSETYFCKIQKEFNLFKQEYKSGEVVPRPEEKKYWDENLKFGQKNFSRGFFDGNKIPTRSQYITAINIDLAMEKLKQKISETEEIGNIKKCSVRIYKDWKSLVGIVSLNLSTIFPDET